MKQNILYLFFILLFLIYPSSTFAHEIYVLDKPEINHALESSSPNPFSAINSNTTLFLFWAISCSILFVSVFLISISRSLEKQCYPFFEKLKPYASLIGRITLGASLSASALYGGLFGPDLPLIQAFGGYTFHAQVILLLCGLLIILGLYTKIAVSAALTIFIFAFTKFGAQLATYFSYAGKMLMLLIVSEHSASLRNAFNKEVRCRYSLYETKRVILNKYGFFVLRVMFGVTIIYSSFYAKFVHSQLALQTVQKYNLTTYFPFEPLFIVLGAFIIETLIGLCIMIGFEIRFMTVIFTVFLVLSILYFGEAVWPHIILFGANAALFAHGYDEYSVEGRFFKKNKYEPVLCLAYTDYFLV